MAALCPPIKIQQFTDNGEFAVGYKLHTYVTDTTTPKATYTDAGGTTPNTNPVILDARGEATLFLSPAEQYRIVLTTAADVTVWTQDGVSAFAATAGSGVTISSTGVVAIDEATEAEMLEMSDAANVVTTRRIRQMLYAGLVTAGTGEGPPYVIRGSDNAQWAVDLTSTGVYGITHDLGLGVSSLTVVASATTDGGRCVVSSISSDTFVVKVYDSSGTLATNPFRFIAMRWINEV